MSIRVLEPGAFTTVQDLARRGCGAWGVPPSGAMDELSLRAANLLVGNEEGAAALEITLRGPGLRFDTRHVVAVAGAPFEVDLNGERIPVGQSFVAPSGATLVIGGTRLGVRCYLAVRGGVDVPVVLGSRSTFVPAGFGGVDGRVVSKQAVLDVGPANAQPDLFCLASTALPSPGHEATLRAVVGPQEDAFTPRAIEAFFSRPYRVSQRSDRAGVRLEGEPLELRRPADLDPEGVVSGAVQVPANGLPIVLGPDRPATGGYVKIATVIAADLSLIAQARPGDTLRFAEVSVAQARTAWSIRLGALHDGIEPIL